MTSLFDAARACLDAATPDAKLEATFAAADAFARGALDLPADVPPPRAVNGTP